MGKVQSKNDIFYQALTKLGFSKDDDCLFLVEETKKLPDPQIQFHIEQAGEFNANAVFLRRQLNGSYKPQAYLFDLTDKDFTQQNEKELTEIQKRIWSSGEAPLACIFYRTEIKILDCTTHITDSYTPVYLVNHLKTAEAAHKLYNEQFAVKIKSGVFWEEEEFKNKFKFQNSSYDILIDNIRFIIGDLQKRYKGVSKELINKLIIQSILIKYLEERIDEDGNKLLSDKYFKKYEKATTFNDVLIKGKLVELLLDLNDPKKGFNGNVFKWTDDEQQKLGKIDLSRLAQLLDADSSLKTGQQSFWRYFEFKYIPVELISRLYEEFLGEDKKDKGMYYTPSHLAKLLVDESIPLKKFKDLNLSNYQILDPACGSGIFLVVVFKRLVQIWRLQNNMKLPELEDLKNILRNIYGIDKEEQAVNLASFSLCLALCNELQPLDIINKLKFDDLRENNLIRSDFFSCEKLKLKKFDLIIGNPPFGVGAIKEYSPVWNYENKKVKIPQGQIALKFLAEAISFLKPKGLQCLIIKSSGLIYNTTSSDFKSLLFSNLNVIQILDFTALARNKSLWDNGADVASAAIFLKNEKPDFKRNILHLTFRRTKATKERIVFEIDDYDLHFVNRQTAINSNFIWKSNLLGGGRVKGIVESFSEYNFGNYLEKNGCIVGEGFKVGSKGHLNPAFIYNIDTMPTEAINEDDIDLDKLKHISNNIKFEKIPNQMIFTAPNIIIWENIGKKRFPIHLNKKSFSFQHKIIGISNQKQPHILTEIINSFKKFNDLYRFYIFATSGQVLVNLNTAILKTDIMNIPFISSDSAIQLSEVDKNVLNDVNEIMQDFMRHGENSKAVKPIIKKSFESFLQDYGREFSAVLNLIYEDQKKKYRLSDVISLNNSFIATIFKYDAVTKEPVFHTDNSKLNLKELSDIEISKHLSANRIIKLYPQKDTIVFIKPNQYRYWLSMTAYRDADKCFADLSNAGY